MNTSVYLSLMLVVATLSGCAYQLGYGRRSLPGGFTSVAIPVFENKSDVVGIEADFTNSLIREFQRSQVADVVDRIKAPAILEGSIERISLQNRAEVKGGSNSELPLLPSDTVLAREYRVLIHTKIRLLKAGSRKQVWSGTVVSERVYTAPQIGLKGVNSANALYNVSARRRTIAQLADDMMNEAHDRITENF